MNKNIIDYKNSFLIILIIFSSGIWVGMSMGNFKNLKYKNLSKEFKMLWKEDKIKQITKNFKENNKFYDNYLKKLYDGLPTNKIRVIKKSIGNKSSIIVDLKEELNFELTETPIVYNFLNTYNINMNDSKEDNYFIDYKVNENNKYIEYYNIKPISKKNNTVLYILLILK